MEGEKSGSRGRRPSGRSGIKQTKKKNQKGRKIRADERAVTSNRAAQRVTKRRAGSNIKRSLGLGRQRGVLRREEERMKRGVKNYVREATARRGGPFSSPEIKGGSFLTVSGPTTRNTEDIKNRGEEREGKTKGNGGSFINDPIRGIRGNGPAFIHAAKNDGEDTTTHGIQTQPKNKTGQMGSTAEDEASKTSHAQTI